MNSPSPIASERIDHESKRFFLDLFENARGRVFRITEDFRGRRSSIMLPTGACPEFLDALKGLVEYADTLPEDGR